MVKVGDGMARPGMDTRSWVEYGTVATVGGADGAPDFGDGDAIVVTPEGIYVDVVLGVDLHPTPCRYGHQHGKVFVLFPIRPGDLVEVTIPGGDLAAGPSISKVLGGDHTTIPVGPDGLPLFQNDRALIVADGVPVDIRTTGGARILVNPDGTVVINEGELGAARLKDSTKLGMQPEEVLQLAAALLATGMFVPGPGPPAPPPPASPPDPDFPTAAVIFTSGEITGASGTVKVG